MGRFKAPLWLQVTLSGLFLIGVAFLVGDRVLQPIESRIESIDSRLADEAERAQNGEQVLTTIVGDLKAAAAVNASAADRLEATVGRLDETVSELKDQLVSIEVAVQVLSKDVLEGRAEASKFFEETRGRLEDLDAQRRQN